MLKQRGRVARFLLLACALAGCPAGEEEAAAPRDEFNIGLSISEESVVSPYAEQAGFVRKWGNKCVVTIRLLQGDD